MSWLARSFANSLRLNEEEIHPGHDFPPSQSGRAMELLHDGNESERVAEGDEEYGNEEEIHGQGVREDLTEFKKTLSRQFWGMANFLAPPPSTLADHLICHEENCSGPHDPAIPVADGLESISPAPDISYPLDDAEDFENEDDLSDEECRPRQVGCVGVTDEVLAFAENIAMHPETWLDFPLEEDNLEDFDMSDAQLKHAFTIEQYAPRLAALRIELCPYHMNESYFWIVYFVLLHSRLSKHDAELLYTPQVIEARTKWMDELYKQTKPEEHWDESTHLLAAEVHCVDKSVINEKLVVKSEAKDLSVGSSKVLAEVDEDDGWLDEDSDLGSCYKVSFSFGNDDEISFSDLEDDK